MVILINGRIKSGKDTVYKMFQYISSTQEFQQAVSLQEWLQNYNPDVFTFFENKKFAMIPKVCLSHILDIPVEDFEDQKVKSSVLSSMWDKDGQSRTVREVMQDFATLLKQLHPAIWPNALMTQYTPQSNWIVTDYRFINELEAVQKATKDFVVVKIERYCTFQEWLNIFEIQLKEIDSKVIDMEATYSQVAFYSLLSEPFCEFNNMTITKEKFLSQVNHISETELDQIDCVDELIVNSSDINYLYKQVENIYGKLFSIPTIQ